MQQLGRQMPLHQRRTSFARQRHDAGSD